MDGINLSDKQPTLHPGTTINFANLVLDNSHPTTKSQEKPVASPERQSATNYLTRALSGGDGSDRSDRAEHKGSTSSTATLQKPQNRLERGVDAVTSLVVPNQEWREEINHYGSNFLTTAALFAGGKVGWIGTGLMYGLANTNPDSSLKEQAEDFMLGAAKGGAVKGLYHVLGNNFTVAPTKGMLMGLASRGAEDIFQRDLFTDPTRALGRLNAEKNNHTALAYDAFVWTAGEFLASGANVVTKGAIANNKFVGGMFMGGTFGMINGGGQEIMRQQASGSQIDWTKVLARGAVQGGLDATAARVGMSISAPAMPSMSENLRRKALLGITATALMLGAAGSAEASGKPTPVEPQTPVPARSNDQGANPGSLPSHDSTNVIHYMSALGPREFKLKPVETRLIPTVGVMAPLLIQDQKGWDDFDAQLEKAATDGHHAVTTDVWWGVIEKNEGVFDWSYYNKLSEHIIAKGLKWTPILSFHECGGNVGDTVNVAVPEWVWTKLAKQVPSQDPRSVQFVSEQGHASKEYVSIWATDLVLNDYANVMRQFQSHFASKANNIAELNISLGPSGELRYPSYNSHDKGTGYPTGGALQCYSDMARESFRQYALKRYGNIEGVSNAWKIPDLLKGIDLNNPTPESVQRAIERINPPTDPNPKPDRPQDHSQAVDDFFNRNDHHNTQYGRDFFDWYSDSLIDHGRKMLGTAVKVFGAQEAPFTRIDIGGKIPGLHWRIGTWNDDHTKVTLGDRRIELTAGLIRTSRNDWNNDADGRGYRPILAMFKEFQPLHPGMGTRVVPAMTCLELPDGNDGPAEYLGTKGEPPEEALAAKFGGMDKIPWELRSVLDKHLPREQELETLKSIIDKKSLAHTLSVWVGQEAKRQNLPIRGENALNWTLPNPAAWDLMSSVMKMPDGTGYYEGLTLLRIGDVVDDPKTRAKAVELIKALQSIPVPKLVAPLPTSPTDDDAKKAS